MIDVCPHGRRYFEMDYQGEIRKALFCSECVHAQGRKARRAELVWQAVLAHIASGWPHYHGFGVCIRAAERDADAFLKWEEEQ